MILRRYKQLIQAENWFAGHRRCDFLPCYSGLTGSPEFLASVCLSVFKE